MAPLATRDGVRAAVDVMTDGTRRAQ